jgi:hypothetical protein
MSKRDWVSANKLRTAWTNFGFVFLLFAVGTVNVLAQPREVFVQYEAAGYKMLMIKGSRVPEGFQSPRQYRVEEFQGCVAKKTHYTASRHS